MNTPQLQLQYQSHPNPRERSFRSAQVTNAKRTQDTIRKYNRGELQYYKTVSQTSGVIHSIPRPVCKINSWKVYTRFSYTADSDQHQLILEPCKDLNNNNTLALCSDGKIKIGYNICTLVGWQAGDTISVAFRGEKAIMKRIKNTKLCTQNVNHIHGTGCFSFLPARLVAKRNGWTVGTRFSCAVEDDKIVLETSADGDLKINSRGRRIGLISIPCSIIASAGLEKRDPVQVDYEDTQIIIRRI